MTDIMDPGIPTKDKKASPSFAARLTRKKATSRDILETKLRRCLNTTEITLLSLGHMVGSGVYVLTGTVSKNMAGPAIILAFVISGVASFLSSLCYAELGVRYPRSGSAYSYTYLALGEFLAFIVGWNVVLEHIISASASSRCFSAYIDSLAGGLVKNWSESLTGNIEYFQVVTYLDFLGFGILILFVLFLSFGVKITSHLNNVFAVTNMLAIITAVSVGSYFANLKNWTNPSTGGFMPYGFSGVLSAAASCFYAYVGFDSIAAAAEEAKEPQKSIPKATVISMLIATLAYVGVSSVLTLMVNYKDIADESGLPEALSSHGAYWAKIIVIVGAFCGIATSIIGSLFALTRISYVMADDGLLFNFCSHVNLKTKLPLFSMYSFSSISAIMALMIDINSLVEFISIGTLFAYLIVGASVIVLRYTPTPKTDTNIDTQELSFTESENFENSPIEVDSAGELRENFKAVRSFFNLSPGKLVTVSVFAYVVFSFLLCGFVKNYYSRISGGSWWAIAIISVLCFCLLLTFILILIHKQSSQLLRYKVPMVPLIPALSILINATLIVNLRVATWLRLLVWVAVGLLIYFAYGMKHSKLEVDASLKPKISNDNHRRHLQGKDDKQTSKL